MASVHALFSIHSAAAYINANQLLSFFIRVPVAHPSFGRIPKIYATRDN